MKHLIALPLIALAACSSPRASDYADAGSTAAFMAQGHVEANPLIASAGNAAPIAAIGMKVLTRSAIDNAPITDEQRKNIHEGMDTVNWAAFCNNVVLLATPELATRLIAAAGCAVAHRYSLGVE